MTYVERDDYEPSIDEPLMAPERRPMLRFIGTTRHGKSVYGVRGPDMDAPTLAKQLYDDGYQDVEIADSHHQIVGGVCKNENGARVWWADANAR